MKPLMEMMRVKKPLHNHEFSYALLRAALGLNVLIHGIIHLTQSDISSAAQALKVGGPAFFGALVRFGAYLAAPAEIIFGMMIFAGFFTRLSLSAGACFTVLFMSVKCFQQHWTSAGLQMIYILFYYLLIDRLSDNRLSVDSLRSSKKHEMSDLYSG